MTYKTILVHAGVDEATDGRMKAALGLGRRFDAALFGVGASAWEPYIVDSPMGYVDGETIQVLRDQVDADIADGESRFGAACAGYPQPLLWRSFVERPDQAMARLARCADLVVTSPHVEGADPRRVPGPANLVMETGLPVVVLAPGADQVLAETVLIGWKDTRETRRAVTDSLPFLRAARKVVVAQVCEDDAVDLAHAGLDDVIGRLERHGVRTEREVVPQLGKTVALDLMDLTRKHGADLLVTGAYGRSRLREWAFGGVTRDLLAGAECSILFGR